MDPIRCAVTGPLGNVGYNIVFFLAGGGVFGPDRKISLALVEIPQLSQQLEGLRMELEDCAFPTLDSVRTGSDPFELFGDIDCAILVGAKPRGPGMERKDLLAENGAIFQKQGQALDRSAKKTVQVLVVGNPCNTNCLIAFHNAPSLSPFQFAAMTRLDELRARAMLAKAASASIDEVSSVTIWGNHSSTLVPDLSRTTIKGKEASSIVDKEWIQSVFLPGVRQRGADIIKARGKSSAASAASAGISAMRALVGQFPQNTLLSMPVYSKDNPYGIDQNLFFSFPCRTGHRGVSMDPSMPPPEYLWKEVRLSEQELIEEREMVRHLFLAQ